jgi:glutamyl-tRNA synthetase
MTDAPVRVRFAPSPTGFFHVGSARASLYNWLFARQQRGTFVLRIEDTDAERNKEEWVEGIFSAMRWLGMDWHELYRQSERVDLYREAAEKLYASGQAYYCDCTAEIVQERTKGNATPGYDSFCAHRGLGPAPGRALRFRTPDDGATVVPDLVRGDPVFENRTIEDFVLVRGNGAAMFILANVVDDIDMRISHVVRGEDHLPNTPKYLLLWDALGGPAKPVFAHLPLLVNEQRKKLSKRRDKVAVEDYREQGYLPEAMVNFLALLGWSPGGDREIVSVDELIAEFRLEDVNSSPAFFDEKKLSYVNGEYIRMLDVDHFIERAAPFLDRSGLAWDRAVFAQVAPLVQERVKLLSEVPSMVDFLFVDEPLMDEKDWDKRVTRGAAAHQILTDAWREYAASEWTAEALHDLTAAIGERYEQSLGKAQFPVRVAVTGRAVGPPLFESLVVLGRERTLARLQAALDRLDRSEAEA